MEIVTNVGDILATKNCESALAGKSCLKWEEADGRILLHVSDMVRLGANLLTNLFFLVHMKKIYWNKLMGIEISILDVYVYAFNHTVYKFII